MPYCNVLHITSILAQSLTTASPSDLTSVTQLLKIGKTLDSNQVPETIINQYITWSDEEINGKISEQYEIPLKEIADFETTLASSMGDYNDYIITTDRSPFNVGDTIIITDGVHEERHVIEEIIDSTTGAIFRTVDPIGFAFQSGSRIIRVKYPDPITQTAARLAAANIYDKYFASQASPNESEYGKFLRKQARQALNNILQGRTILHGAVRIGRRFFNPTLKDRYDLPGTTGANDMDDLA